MITKEIILYLHEQSILEYGGSHGTRDEGLMESAIARPYQTFDGNDLYPSLYEKAAAIAESIIINHPFIDGNKRTGYLAMLAILKTGNLYLTAKNDAIYDFVICISTGDLNSEQIVEWLKANTAEKK
jgi:death on curing protein